MLEVVVYTGKRAQLTIAITIFRVWVQNNAASEASINCFLLYKSLSLSLDHKVLENLQGLRILQTVCYVCSSDVYKFCYHHRA